MNVHFLILIVHTTFLGEINTMNTFTLKFAVNLDESFNKFVIRIQVSDACTLEPPDADPTLTTTTTESTTTTTIETTTETTPPTTTTEGDWNFCTFQNGLCGWRIDEV